MSLDTSHDRPGIQQPQNQCENQHQHQDDERGLHGLFDRLGQTTRRISPRAPSSAPMPSALFPSGPPSHAASAARTIRPTTRYSKGWPWKYQLPNTPPPTRAITTSHLSHRGRPRCCFRGTCTQVVYLPIGRPGGNRTPNLRFWRPLLYQLSYWPNNFPVGGTQLERSAPALSRSLERPPDRPVTRNIWRSLPQSAPGLTTR